MKSTFPDLDIGLQIVARKTLDYYNNPTIIDCKLYYRAVLRGDGRGAYAPSAIRMGR